jgi:hypothetical protein
VYTTITRLITIAFLLLCPRGAVLFGQFAWDPVPPSVWDLREDTSKGEQHAVMIFEKAVADDRNLEDEECYYSIYRRLMLFSADAKKWGDVAVEYLPETENIEVIQARTVLPDGREIVMQKGDTHTKEIFKSEGLKVKEVAFSLPGLTEKCLVEYYVRYRMKNGNHTWLFQKEIPLLHGEYRWKFHQGQTMRAKVGDYVIVYSGVFPNYLAVNALQQVKVEQIPSNEHPEEAVFSIQNVPAFHPEPFTFPDQALKGQLRFYYGSGVSAVEYWSYLSEAVRKHFDDFAREKDRLKPVLAECSKAGGTQEQINAAYQWLQKNMKNISYVEDSKEFKPNETIDDALERKYGSGADINLIFYTILGDMKIPTIMSYMTDRDRSLFYSDAKYWQFDRSMVAVPEAGGTYRYYSPGDLFLPVTHTPWQSEGVLALQLGPPRNEAVRIYTIFSARTKPNPAILRPSSDS